MSSAAQPIETDRQTMEVDIACAGFGPATGGFLTTLTQAWSQNPADPAFESRVAPGMPLQVLCYERADDLAAGVSGVVTRAEGIRSSFPTLDPAEIPMAAAVKQERVFYLLDPIGASRRSALLRLGDFFLRLGRKLWLKDLCLRAALDARVSAQERRAGALHRPVQPVGRLATDGQRPGADLARHAGQRPDLR